MRNLSFIICVFLWSISSAQQGSNKRDVNEQPEADLTLKTEPSEKDIALYPNPTSGVVYVMSKLEADEEGKITFYTMQGIKVKELPVKGGTSVNRLSIHDFQKGVYGYSITTTKDYHKTGKLVVLE